MPNFKKTEVELETRLDKWLYFIRHLEDFQTIPQIFTDDVFKQVFEKAELAKFGQEELDRYENSLKNYRDLKGAIDTAFDEGKLEVGRNLKRLGVDTAIISEATGLTKEQIDKL